MNSYSDLGSYRPVSPVKDHDVHPATREATSPMISMNEDFDDDKDERSRRQQMRRNTDTMMRMTRLDKFNGWANKRWFWEILSIFLSMASLGVVIWRLYTIDQQPYSLYENTRPSPNTFVSIFVAAAKALAVFAVASGIGQLKWLYYRSTPRSLDGLDAFDGASRGAGGSMLFLSFTEFGHGSMRLVACLGALITVVSLAMDPFAQEILTYPSRHVELPQTESAAWMSAFESHGDSVTLFGDNGRQATIGGVLGFDVPMSNGCVTGNCTWPPFTSLGICSSCSDSTNSILPTCVEDSGIINHNCTQLQYQFLDDVSLILQNGSSIDRSTERQYTLFNSNVSQQAPPRGFQNPTQFSFALASFNIDLKGGADNSAQLANPSWTITNCSLGWCAKVYENLSVVNNILVNTVPHDVPVQPVANSACWSNPAHNCQEFEPVASEKIPSLRNKTFRITVGDSNVQIRNIMEFNYNVTIQANTTSIITGDQWTYSFASLIFFDRNITSVFQNVATTYTNFLRNVDNSFNITGTATEYESYVNVTWRWFILPAVVVLVSAAFLITVILCTKYGSDGKNVIWKTTSLPLLLHGLEGWDKEEYGGTESSAEMNARARNMKAILQRDDAGRIRFVNTR